MVLHKILKRQFNRFGLDENSLPTDMHTWQELIKRINQSYINADQEKYLLERSMDISSKEMRELNSKLEEAQHLARLGNWHIDLDSKHSTWSNELYQLFELDPALPPPSFDKIINYIQEDKQKEFKENLDTAIKTGKGFEAEIPIRNSKDIYKYYHVIIHPKVEADSSVKEMSGIVMDITKRKEAEEQFKLLNQRLVASARKAGMSEVATAILHNVGNILNSVNVSLGLIHENMNLEAINKLLSIEKIIQDNKENLGEYFTNDAKGKLIPDYLLALTQKFSASYDLVLTELRNLKDKIEHIKEITAMQKSISGVSGIVEKVYVPEIIETAINMYKKEFEMRSIGVEKNLNNASFVQTDKAKLMQILINLIQNAKDAVSDAKKPHKLITITVNQGKDLQIRVEDNGIGILPENLQKIFTFGFTTKTHGHGFGLHSSALTAKELGGSLQVESSGYQQGTTFILTLPMAVMAKRKEYESKAESENYSN